MKSLNRRKRNMAFLKVVGFFLVAFIIALLLSFMTIKSPQLSDKRCQENLLELQESLEFQREIIRPNVSKTKGLIQQIPDHNIQGDNLEVLNSDIGSIISNLNREIQNLQTPDTTFYKDVILLMSKLQMAYNRQLDLGETASDVNEISMQLQLCKTENKQLEDQVSSLQANAPKATDCSKYTKQIRELQDQLGSKDAVITALQREIAKLRNQSS